MDRRTKYRGLITGHLRDIYGTNTGHLQDKYETFIGQIRDI